MSKLDQQFSKAQSNVKKLSERPSNESLLKLYGLYKQGAEGDVSGKRPGMLDIKNRAKFDSWKSYKGIDADTAKQNYIDLVDQLTKE